MTSFARSSALLVVCLCALGCDSSSGKGHGLGADGGHIAADASTKQDASTGTAHGGDGAVSSDGGKHVGGDASSVGTDAGPDAGTDAGSDAGSDAGTIGGACATDLPCAAPSGSGGDEICISGRVVDAADSANGIDAATAAAIEVRLYDSLMFMANPAGAPPFQTLTTQNGGLDDCGRFSARFSVSTAAPLGNVASIATGRTGGGTNDYVLTATMHAVAAGSNVSAARAVLLTRTQDAVWATAAGLASSATFASTGSIAVRFHEGDAVSAGFAGTPIRGVVPRWQGLAEPSRDYFFTDSSSTSLQAVSAAPRITGSNGFALLYGPVGTGELSAGLGCTTATGASGTLVVSSPVLAATAAGIITFTDVAASCTPNPAVVVTALATQSSGFLSDPRALAVSPKDGALYVADRELSGACNPSCILKVDATSGAADSTPVVVGSGTIEGVAFDATGDNLYYSDRADRIGRLTWDGAAYVNAVTCNDVSAQSDPYHLVVDATLGVLVADDASRDVLRYASCAPSTVASTFSQQSLSQPRGIALDGSGAILVSSTGGDAAISMVDRTTGAVTLYQREALAEPRAITWLGGTSFWADSLLVADHGTSQIVSVTSSGTRVVTTLESPPVDVAVAAGTLYVLSASSGAAPAHIYKATGF